MQYNMRIKYIHTKKKNTGKVVWKIYSIFSKPEQESKFTAYWFDNVSETVHFSLIQSGTTPVGVICEELGFA